MSAGLEKQPKNDHERKSVVLNAITMALGTFSSRILGLIRDAVTVAVFDRTVTDAWLVAFRLPNLFRRMLGEGSLSVAFIPVFIGTLTKGPSSQPVSEAHKLAYGIFTLLFAFLSVLTAAGIIFADQILIYLVPGQGYLSVQGKFELTVHMAKIMFGFIFFISMYAYFMAILNSLKRFTAGAFAPVIFNISLIASSLFHDDLRWPGESLAWGVLIGGFLQMAWLIPSLAKEGFLPRFSFKVWSPEIRQVLQSLLPSWIGVGILQLASLINVRFASELPEGTHSWIYTADRLLELPLSLVAVSLGSALLPTLARHWASGQREEMIQTSMHFLKLTFFLAIPASVGIYALSYPIIEVLFERGRFTAHDTLMTASILQIYTFSVLTYSGVRVIVSPYYAIKNTWFPAAVSGVALVIHYFLAQSLVFSQGMEGLAWATVASSAVNFMLLFGFHFYFIGPVQLGDFLLSIVKYTIAALAMAFLLQVYTPLAELLQPLSFHQPLALAISIICGALVFFSVSLLIRTKETHEALGILKRKLGRKK
ncbi:MAG: murein biosynthesis integral membrane protein MurJ [Bdellovibrionales bacterium]